MSDDSKSYPMISSANWWKIRDKFQATLPTKVTASYLVSLLNLKDNSSATSNALSPMKTLGLVNQDGEPTDLAQAWRLDDSYEDACNEMLKSVYPKELLELLPEKEIDKSVAESWFMREGVGKAAAQKMTRLFALLKEADLSKRTTKSSSTKSPKGKDRHNNIVNSEKKQEMSKAENISVPQADSRPQKEPSMHIDLQIHISPNSTPEQIEAIFSSMAKHLYGNE